MLERSVMEATDLIVLSPSGFLDPSPAIAACRAGARGTLDLEFADASAVAAIERLAKFAGPRFGLKLGTNTKLPQGVQPAWVILACGDCSQLPSLREAGIEVLVEAVRRP